MRIIYLYDVENWAIHNVGILWLKNSPYEVTFKSIDLVNGSELESYDFIWYGYSSLYFKVPIKDTRRIILSVHDPCELFSSHKYWKTSNIPITLDLKTWFDFLRKRSSRKKTIHLLKNMENIVTTSTELHDALSRMEIKSTIIKTTTDIPTINEKDISNEEISVISIANNHFRKNFRLLNKIKRFCISNKIPFEIKQGVSTYSRENYIRLLKNHTVYVCTSFQEGGPLPAMDAMACGEVVLTTPVGQIQEILNMQNGFICRNFKEFTKNLLLLKNDPSLLRTMRLESLATIKKVQQRDIKNSVTEYLETLWHKLASNR